MSKLENILIRMMNDPEFAGAVFDDPQLALAEYDLSVDEIGKFKELTHEQFAAMSPDDRKSMISFVGGWGSSMYQYG